MQSWCYADDLDAFEHVAMEAVTFIVGKVCRKYLGCFNYLFARIQDCDPDLQDDVCLLVVVDIRGNGMPAVDRFLAACMSSDEEATDSGTAQRPHECMCLFVISCSSVFLPRSWLAANTPEPRSLRVYQTANPNYPRMFYYSSQIARSNIRGLGR